MSHTLVRFVRGVTPERIDGGLLCFCIHRTRLCFLLTRAPSRGAACARSFETSRGHGAFRAHLGRLAGEQQQQQQQQQQHGVCFRSHCSASSEKSWSTSVSAARGRCSVRADVKGSIPLALSLSSLLPTLHPSRARTLTFRLPNDSSDSSNYLSGLARRHPCGTSLSALTCGRQPLNRRLSFSSKFLPRAQDRFALQPSLEGEAVPSSNYISSNPAHPRHRAARRCPFV
jgi:hypothetical protein